MVSHGGSVSGSGRIPSSHRSRAQSVETVGQPQNIYSFYLIESLDAAVAQWVAYVHVERGLVAR
jgi:hypothetical protein